jgi:hypothetical protein
MRTHLLHTVHIPPAAESDTGTAANDSEYDRSSLTPQLRALATPDPARRALSPEDEYTLGGYAGI